MISPSLILTDEELQTLTQQEKKAYLRSLEVLEAKSVLLAEFEQLSQEERKKRFKELSENEQESLRYRWQYWRREKQVLPTDRPWNTWLILAGRGFGKTRVGAETVRHWIKQGFQYVNLIGPTSSDIRDAMVKGESGILKICPPDERPDYVGNTLRWPNGAISLLFSAEEPERLRNKQHEKLWADELAGWQYQQDAWDMAMFGLRLGNLPQTIVTTTPKPTKLIKYLAKDPRTYVTRGTTYENRPNLAPAFFQNIITKYENTRLGRQELQAEILEDNPGALWTQKMFEDTRIAVAPTNLRRVVVAVDPAVTAGEDSDEWGIVVAAKDDQRPPHFYVLAEYSDIYTPDQAINKVLWAYEKHDADRVVAEVNQGGDMIEALLRTKKKEFAYTAVHATKGKYTRAEPISALWEQGRAHCVGCFPKLEDQSCDYVPGISEKSPDVMDSMVWAMTELSAGYSSWVSDVARQAKEAEVKLTPNSALDSPELATTLSQAQKRSLGQELTTSSIFGADKMSGKVSINKPLAKVAVNAKTPACPVCGNKVLSSCGPLVQCRACGWDNQPKLDPDGNPVQLLQKAQV